MFNTQYNRKSSRQRQPSRNNYNAPQEAAQNAPEPPQLPRTGFMAELDEWLDFTIIEPIQNAIAGGDAKSLHIAFIESKQLLKRKVLASYHNGLKASAETNRSRNDT